MITWICLPMIQTTQVEFIIESFDVYIILDIYDADSIMYQ